jgi:hypothetical protein
MITDQLTLHRIKVPALDRGVVKETWRWINVVHPVILVHGKSRRRRTVTTARRQLRRSLSSGTTANRKPNAFRK